MDEILAGDYPYMIQRWATLLKTAHGNSEERMRFIDAEYGASGAILHGDQLASWEVFLKPDGEGSDRLPNFDSVFPERRVLGTAMHLTVLLMDAIGEAVGRDHAVHSASGRVVR